MDLNTQSKEQFANSVMGMLQERGETRPMRFDADAFSIHFAEDDDRIYLGNVYRELMESPPQNWSGVIEPFLITARMCKSEFHIPAQWSEAKADIRVQVRRRVDVESESTKSAADLTLITPDLCICPVFDMAYGIGFITGSQAASWGVTVEEVLQAGMENLRRVSREPFTRIGSGTYIGSWDDSYDATRLVFPEMLQKLQIRGDHVAVVPHRNTLIVTGTEDKAGLELTARHTGADFQKARSLSGRAYRLTDGKWKWFLPPKGHPAHGPLLHCAKLMRIREYDIQRAHLFETQDKFVGTVLATRTNTDILTTISFVGEGGTLLPRTDHVVFVSVAGDLSVGSIHAALTWDRMLELFAHRIKRVDVYPERYHVTFPTQQELDALNPEEADPAKLKSLLA